MKTKRPTIKWYNDDGRYMGWNYVDKVTYRQARSWLLSGNYIISGKKTYNSFSTTSILLNLFPR